MSLITKDDILSLSGVSILVIGDVMLDHYIIGKTERISPEAPVPVVLVEKEFNSLGGAANVAANTWSLGGKTTLCGLLGRSRISSPSSSSLEFDHDGLELITKCRDLNLDFYFLPFLPCTISKTRVIANRQQVVRFDREHILGRTSAESQQALESGNTLKPLPLTSEQLSIRNHTVSKLIKSCDVILVSDYAKGMIDRDLITQLISSCKPVIVDPKPENKSFYRGVYLITPNLKEARQMCYSSTNSLVCLEDMAEHLSREFSSHSLITLGEDGMYLYTQSGFSDRVLADSQEVFDVTGAGDTVVAVMSLAIGAGLDLSKAMRLANYAAGIVVGKIGTSYVTSEQLISILSL